MKSLERIKHFAERLLYLVGCVAFVGAGIAGLVRGRSSVSFGRYSHYSMPVRGTAAVLLSLGLVALGLGCLRKVFRPTCRVEEDVWLQLAGIILVLGWLGALFFGLFDI